MKTVTPIINRLLLWQGVYMLWGVRHSDRYAYAINRYCVKSKLTRIVFQWNGLYGFGSRRGKVIFETFTH